MTSMADFILLGHEKVGSFALSSSKTDLFTLALIAILDSIRDVLNNYAVPRLFNLNVFNGITAYPRIEHGDVESPDLMELGNFISTMAGSGALTLPDPDLENYLREAASLPAKKEDLEQNTTPEVDNEKTKEEKEADEEKKAQMAKFTKALPVMLLTLYKGFIAANGGQKKNIKKTIHGSHCQCTICKSTSRLL
jgi:hypothetical protein